MVEFITWLKALAALLITNSHLGKIYPLESLATGGLLGNLLFFSVSGFCLYHIRQPFYKWYLRRLFRIYPALWIATGICISVGTYEVYSWSHAINLFVYPTYYHFIASILLLYIPFYLVSAAAHHCIHPGRVLGTVVILVTIAYALVYTCLYDKSYYHIDTVEEPMILFIYFLSMLMGAYFRQLENISCKGLLIFCTLISTAILYGGSKILVGNGTIPAAYQFVNQATLLLLLLSLLFAGHHCNTYLAATPSCIRRGISFIATITLEIYLVQYLILRSPLLNHLSFPTNLVAALLLIALAAWVLHYIITVLNKCLSTPH